MVRENLDRETAKIESLVGDWQNKEDLVDAVDALGRLTRIYANS